MSDDRSPDSDASERTGATSRRTFLRRAGGVALGLSLVPLSACEQNTVQALGTQEAGGGTPFLTPVPDFYVVNGGESSVDNWPGIPDIDPTTWSLTVGGLVDRELELSFQDLQNADGAVTILKTMRCVLNPEAQIPGFVGTALWTGVPLRRVLEQAGIDRTRTRRLRLFARDGFNNNLRMERVYGPQARPGPILAYRMNGQPIPEENGFPVRVIAPRQYGFKSVKWIERIEATADDSVFGQYQNAPPTMWDDNAFMRVSSKVTEPSNIRTAPIPAGDVQIGGYALAGAFDLEIGQRAIERVEVAVDDEGFQPADVLSRESVFDAAPENLQSALMQSLQWSDSDYTYPFAGVWAFWQRTIRLDPGRHTIRVRATDGLGNTQPARDDRIEDGNTGVFEIDVTAR
jgi:DMSO/TMAO reductase YedYZ molybdopterin-dependent catalytic subunit